MGSTSAQAPVTRHEAHPQLGWGHTRPGFARAGAVIGALEVVARRPVVVP